MSDITHGHATVTFDCSIEKSHIKIDIECHDIVASNELDELIQHFFHRSATFAKHGVGNTRQICDESGQGPVDCNQLLHMRV